LPVQSPAFTSGSGSRVVGVIVARGRDVVAAAPSGAGPPVASAVSEGTLTPSSVGSSSPPQPASSRAAAATTAIVIGTRTCTPSSSSQGLPRPQTLGGPDERPVRTR